jgi:hypothetical protein
MEGTNKPANVQTYSYGIIAQPTNKKYSVARFPGTQSFDFNKLTVPIKMQREKEVDVEEVPALPTINTSISNAMIRSY